MNPEDAIAKLVWKDPQTGKSKDFLLGEGATASIGRSTANDIQIPNQHVSRQHAVVVYRDGMFTINDLGSSNGTFVNDEPVTEPFPLFAGDTIRLFEPELRFVLMDEDSEIEEDSAVIEAANPDGQGSLTIINGPQEGQTVPLLLSSLIIGRAITTATWEVLLQDASVSRPHARMERQDGQWQVIDLGSSNGTKVNGREIAPNAPTPLADGDKVEMGDSILLFRTGWHGSAANDAFPTYDPTMPKR